MSSDIVTIDAGVSILEASKLMATKDIGYIIVLDETKPTGIVTERDIIKVIAKEKDPSKVKISEVMSTPLITIDPDSSVEDAVKIMSEHKIRRLPVVKNNVIQGIFTTRDLTKYFSKYLDRVTRDLVNTQSVIPPVFDLDL